MKDRRVVVFGAAGCVGSQITSQLLRRDCTVVLVDQLDQDTISMQQLGWT